MGSRIRKKVLAKTNWFKRKSPKEGEKLVKGGKGKGKPAPKKETRTRSVLFVEQTPEGELSSRLRELLNRLEHLMGFRIKIVERGGTSLKDMFPLTNIWEGAACERPDCVTCHQGAKKVVNCKKRSLVYENICALCHPDAGDLKKLKMGEKQLL